MEIPKIIHQIWSGGPLPNQLKIWGETWKSNHPDWKYEYWDNERMNHFMKENFLQFSEKYYDFPFNIQRWDAIRYLILYKMGGMYIDFDYESLKPISEVIHAKTCCFSQEPPRHRTMTEKFFEFNNAMMISIPNHPFMKKIIEAVFSENNVVVSSVKYRIVFGTTGPWIINDLYSNLDKKLKKEVYIIPYELVSPIDLWQIHDLKEEKNNYYNENAYAIHHYLGSWNT